MDVFSLTETEFFRKLTYGENDNLHIAYKDGDKPLTYGGTTPRGQ